ncbi:hypothetical protein TNCV_1834811 [Trichonephila clavipes]|nr:hypothetical protein TNCV_1834811 [Trichonephila clavipes]
MEIRTSSSDNNSSSYKSNNFEGMQPRTNESQYSRENGSGERPEKRGRRDEAVMPSTSGYNLRPRRGAKVDSRPSSKRTQQGGPVRYRGSREKQQYRPYAEEHRRSSSRNTRSRRGQQQELPGDEKRDEEQQIPLPGIPSRRRVLQDIKIRLYGFIIHFSDKQSGELLQHESLILVL